MHTVISASIDLLMILIVISAACKMTLSAPDNQLIAADMAVAPACAGHLLAKDRPPPAIVLQQNELPAGLFDDADGICVTNRGQGQPNP